MLVVLLYLAFPVLCISAVPLPSKRCHGSTAERVVYGIAAYEFLLLVFGLVLGQAHRLTTTNYLILTLSAALILGLYSRGKGFPSGIRGSIGFLKTRRGGAAIALASVMAITYAVELGGDGLYGTKQYDGLSYHIPRVIFWVQKGNFDAWPTPFWPQIGLPVGADIILGQKILLGGGWFGTGYVTFILTVGAVACVYIAALELGFSRWNAVMSAILFGSFPAIGMRIWSMNSDIAATFPVLASYVALRRVRRRDIGIALFVVLSGMAVACKQTVIFQVMLLGCVALWQRSRPLLSAESLRMLPVAAALSLSLVVLSFLPVYNAFGNIDGGVSGRSHKVASLSEFNHAVALNACHWLLEPLGYLAPVPGLEDWVKDVATRGYRMFGAQVDALPEEWKPWPSQDCGRSGLVPLMFLPILLFLLPAKARAPSALLFVLGFVPLSGILRFQPWNSRYTIAVLAGYALIWGGAGFFRHGLKRWLLAGITAINLLALFGVVLMRYHVDMTVKAQPGGLYYFLSDQDREKISRSLNGRPLQVITDGSMDSLLVGPEISLKLEYVLFPAGSDLSRELKKRGETSNWVAIVHDDDSPLLSEPTWLKPEGYRHDIPFAELESCLRNSGWRRFKQNRNLDLWEKV